MAASIGFSNETTTRDRMLTDAARALSIGAALHAFFALGVLLVSILPSLGIGAGLPEVLQSAFLFNASVPAPTATAIMILLSLVATSGLLVTMVGVLARELWALPLLAVGTGVGALLLVGLGFTPILISIGACLMAVARIARDLNAFRVNPVMMKELRGRMRGFRAFGVLTIYLSLMGGIALLLYLIYGSVVRATGSAAAGEIGRVLFFGIIGIELLLILFIAPAFTAGAITGERERQTYDLLQTTLLAKATFVIGKLESALAYIILLLLSGIPLQSLAFLFGGVSEGEIAIALAILVATAILFGTVGMYFSAALDRTLLASARAYGVVLGAVFVAPVVINILMNVASDLIFTRQNVPMPPVIETLFQYLSLLLTSVNPLAAGIGTQVLLVNQNVIGFYTYTLASNGATIPMVSPWILLLVIYLSASAALITLTIRKASREEENA